MLRRAILEFVAATDTSRLDAEYLALTEGCGLLDRSERGKLALTGSGAKEFLAGQVTNDIEALSPGGGCYAAFLTPKGKMLGDCASSTSATSCSSTPSAWRSRPCST